MAVHMQVNVANGNVPGKIISHIPFCFGCIFYLSHSTNRAILILFSRPLDYVHLRSKGCSHVVQQKAGLSYLLYIGCCAHSRGV